MLRWSRKVLTKDEAKVLLDEAARLFESVGDDISAARALHLMAAITGVPGAPEFEQLALRAREHYARAGLGPGAARRQCSRSARRRGHCLSRRPSSVVTSCIDEVASPGYRELRPAAACRSRGNGRSFSRGARATSKRLDSAGESSATPRASHRAGRTTLPAWSCSPAPSRRRRPSWWRRARRSAGRATTHGCGDEPRPPGGGLLPPGASRGRPCAHEGRVGACSGR